MNPFPANSLDDTENERPQSEMTTPTLLDGVANSNHQMNGSGSSPITPRQSMSFPGQRTTEQGAKQIRFKEGLDVFLVREILAVAIWSLTIPLFAVVLLRLIEEANQLERHQRKGDPRVSFAVLAWLILRLLPAKLRAKRAPGYLFSQFFVLLRIEETFDLYPNLGCRICEWRLGRISALALFLAFIVHGIVPSVIWGSISMVWKEYSLTDESCLYALRYEDDSSDQIMIYFFLQEVLANALFPVAIMVVPALLRLNDLPEWLSVIVIYPLYSIGVDWDGKGSTLSSAPFIAHLMIYRQFRFQENWRLLAQLLGNLLAGAVMQNVFPDEPAM
ncbi:hypothetical protein ACA910_007753 [Epithemia clementina (nom. ined.)]